MFLLISESISQVALVVKNLLTNAGKHKSFRFDPRVEKKMATLSSILAWRIPWTEELGRLQSMGSQRVIYN